MKEGINFINFHMRVLLYAFLRCFKLGTFNTEILCMSIYHRTLISDQYNSITLHAPNKKQFQFIFSEMCRQRPCQTANLRATVGPPLLPKLQLQVSRTWGLWGTEEGKRERPCTGEFETHTSKKKCSSKKNKHKLRVCGTHFLQSHTWWINSWSYLFA